MNSTGEWEQLGWEAEGGGGRKRESEGDGEGIEGVEESQRESEGV